MKRRTFIGSLLALPAVVKAKLASPPETLPEWTMPPPIPMRHNALDDSWDVEFVVTDAFGFEEVIARMTTHADYQYYDYYGRVEAVQVADFPIINGFDTRWVTLHARGTIHGLHTETTNKALCRSLSADDVYRTKWTLWTSKD